MTFPSDHAGVEARASAWADFLSTRMRLIGEWTREGKTPNEIASTLSMDPTQVRLIAMAEADERTLRAQPPSGRTPDVERVVRALDALRNIAWHIGEELQPDPNDAQWWQHCIDLRAALDEADAVLAALRVAPAASQDEPC